MWLGDSDCHFFLSSFSLTFSKRLRLAAVIQTSGSNGCRTQMQSLRGQRKISPIATSGRLCFGQMVGPRIARAIVLPPFCRNLPIWRTSSSKISKNKNYVKILIRRSFPVRSFVNSVLVNFLLLYNSIFLAFRGSTSSKISPFLLM